MSHHGHWWRVWPCLSVFESYAPLLRSSRSRIYYFLRRSSSTDSFTYYHQDAEQTNFLITFLYCVLFLLLFRLLAMRPFSDSLFWSRRFAMSSCSHDYASLDASLWTLCATSICLARWLLWKVSFKIRLPMIRRVFMSVSETGLIKIFCHTMGTDEECDLAFQYLRAMLRF